MSNSKLNPDAKEFVPFNMNISDDIETNSLLDGRIQTENCNLEQDQNEQQQQQHSENENYYQKRQGQNLNPRRINMNIENNLNYAHDDDDNDGKNEFVQYRKQNELIDEDDNNYFVDDDSEINNSYQYDYLENDEKIRNGLGVDCNGDYFVNTNVPITTTNFNDMVSTITDGIKNLSINSKNVNIINNTNEENINSNSILTKIIKDNAIPQKLKIFDQFFNKEDNRIQTVKFLSSNDINHNMNYNESKTIRTNKNEIASSLMNQNQKLNFDKTATTKFISKNFDLNQNNITEQRKIIVNINNDGGKPRPLTPNIITTTTNNCDRKTSNMRSIFGLKSYRPMTVPENQRNYMKYTNYLSSSSSSARTRPKSVTEQSSAQINNASIYRTTNLRNSNFSSSQYNNNNSTIFCKNQSSLKQQQLINSSSNTVTTTKNLSSSTKSSLMYPRDTNTSKLRKQRAREMFAK